MTESMSTSTSLCICNSDSDESLSLVIVDMRVVLIRLLHLGILYIDLTVIDSVARLELFTSCHYGCLGDHEGMGANRWAPSHDSVGEAWFLVVRS